jgi:hypothetical protein
MIYKHICFLCKDVVIKQLDDVYVDDNTKPSLYILMQRYGATRIEFVQYPQ